MKCKKCGIRNAENGMDYCSECVQTVLDNKDTPIQITEENEKKLKLKSERFKYLEVIENKNEKEETKKVEIKESYINEKLIKSERKIELDEYEKIKIEYKKIIEEQDIKDEKFIKKERELITDYFNKIPHHDLKNLGDIIDIINCTYLPAYKIILYCYYNERTLKTDHYPYLKAEVIPEPTVTVDNVNLWSYPLNNEKDFEPFSESYIINASKNLETCSSCHGSGKLICYSCRGTGRVSCNSCGGSGRNMCFSCGGRGYVSEYSSYEKRSISVPCRSCMGTGYKICSSCDGTGIRTCFECGGSGTLVCSNCSGTGKIVTYLYFDDCYDNIISSDIVFSEKIDNKIKSKISDNEKNFIDITQNIFNEIPKNITDFVTENNSVKNKFKKLYLNFNGKKKNFKEFNVRFLKEKVEIKKLDIYKVEYKYNEKKYEIYICGNNLYSTESPVYEYAESYYKKAKELYYKKKYDHAYKSIRKALEMFDEYEWEDFEEKILSKINKDYFIGTVLSIIFFIVFLVYLYLNFNLLFQTPRFFKENNGLAIIILMSLIILTNILIEKYFEKYQNVKIVGSMIRKFFAFTFNLIINFFLFFLIYLL